MFNFIGGSVLPDEGRYQDASDWAGMANFPQSGDTADIAAIPGSNAGISRVGALFLFPINGGYTQVDFFPPQNSNTLQSDPNAI